MIVSLTELRLLQRHRVLSARPMEMAPRGSPHIQETSRPSARQTLSGSYIQLESLAVNAVFRCISGSKLTTISNRGAAVVLRTQLLTLLSVAHTRLGDEPCVMPNVPASVVSHGLPGYLSLLPSLKRTVIVE